MQDPGIDFYIGCEIFIPYSKALQPVRSILFTLLSTPLLFTVTISNIAFQPCLLLRCSLAYSYVIFFASVSYALLQEFFFFMQMTVEPTSSSFSLPTQATTLIHITVYMYHICLIRPLTYKSEVKPISPSLCFKHNTNKVSGITHQLNGRVLTG